MSLKRRAVKGVQWTTASTIINVSTQFALIAILARILSPEDFGLVGMVMIVIGFAQMFSDMGMSAAIIHYQEIEAPVLSSLYWINIISGMIIFSILISITPLVVHFFDEPLLKNLYLLSSFNFLILPIGQQFQTLMEKELRFDTIGKIEILSVTVSRTIAIILAFLGVGVFSIVWGRLINTFIRSILLLINGLNLHRPAFHFSFAEVKKFLSFGMYKMGQLTLNYFGSRFDQILIGKFLGATYLGYYTLAFELVLQPLKRINPIINRVFFPVYARLQKENEKLREIFFRTLKYLGLIAYPMLFGLIALAKPFVLTVYGDNWLEIVNLLQVLALVAVVIVHNNPFGSIILAKGRADIAFHLDLGVLIVRVIAIALTVKYGLIYIAFGLLVANLLIKFASYFLFMKPMLGRCLLEYAYNAFLVPVFYSFIMCVGLFIIIQFVNLDALITLVAGTVVGGIIYFFVLLIFERRLVYKFFEYFRSKISSLSTANP